jgi:hypothetical protein
LSEFQIIDLNGKINEIHILPTSFATTYSYTNENGKLIYGIRANRMPNQIKNLLGDIASGYLQPVITQAQALRGTSLASGPMFGMNRNMKNLTLERIRQGWYRPLPKARNPWNQNLSVRGTAWRSTLLPAVGIMSIWAEPGPDPGIPREASYDFLICFARRPHPRAFLMVCRPRKSCHCEERSDLVWQGWRLPALANAGAPGAKLGG